ncbi:MAG: hypothetical protein ACI8RD_003724 [Bacillariaceae sp.]|jgi:hypothetical protein
MSSTVSGTKILIDTALKDLRCWIRRNIIDTSTYNIYNIYILYFEGNK